MCIATATVHGIKSIWSSPHDSHHNNVQCMYMVVMHDYSTCTLATLGIFLFQLAY